MSTLAADDSEGFYLLPRSAGRENKPAPSRINSRAIYALKDLDVRHVLAWGPGGAITHNIAVGDFSEARFEMALGSESNGPVNQKFGVYIYLAGDKLPCGQILNFYRYLY